jgi:hypothetical protein
MISARNVVTDDQNKTKVMTINEGTLLLGKKFILENKLGSGRTSEVRKAIRCSDEATFAVKLHYNPDSTDI